MAKTHPTMYSALATGLMKGNMGFLSKLDNAFEFPVNAPAGAVVTVDMLSTITTETPTPGTFLAEGVSNTTASLTLGHKFATDIRTANQTDSGWNKGGGPTAIAQAMADQLVIDMQGVVIAGLKAAAITTHTATLTTTYIDGVLPSSKTIDDAVREYVQPIDRFLAKILASNTGRPLSEFYILTSTSMLGNLIALNRQAAGKIPLSPVDASRARWMWDPGVEIFGVDGTNFGGAGNEALFIGHKKGYAFQNTAVRPWRGGEFVEDGDGQLRRSYYCAYASGLVKESLLAQLVNPAS